MWTGGLNQVLFLSGKETIIYARRWYWEDWGGRMCKAKEKQEEGGGYHGREAGH